MAKIKNESFETNSFWSRCDVSTRTYFDILCDYKPKRLLSIIQNPMNDDNNKELRVISRRLYSSNGIVRNTLDYMQALPTLDYIVTSYSKDESAKANKEIMRYVMRHINHKNFIRDALLKGGVDGTAIYYIDTGSLNRDRSRYMNIFDAKSISEVNAEKANLSDIKVSIKSLPIDYCRIVGTKNNRYVVAFDLDYFNQGQEGTQSKLRKYPIEIVNAYNRWQKQEGGKQMFVLDNRKTIVHKVSSNLDEPWGRPLVLSAILDILYSDYFTNTKRKILDNVNNKIIYETFPEGKVAGTSALSDKQQREQHEAVKNAVQNKQGMNGTTFFSVAAGTKIGDISVNTDLFDNDYESNLDTKVGTDLGFAASLLNASGTTSFSSQQTNLELVTAQIFGWIENIMSELNKVINYNVLGLDYVDIEAHILPITHINRNKHFETAKELLTIGRGSLAYLATCAGLPKEVYFEMLDEQLEEGVMDKYPVNATSYNTSGDSEDSDGGRPTIDSPTNENTIRSKTNDSNNQPKPSV